MYFTHKEKTVKDKTVDEAIKQAKFVLKEEHNACPAVTNAANKYFGDQGEKTLITIEQMSNLVNEILRDSLKHHYN